MFFKFPMYYIYRQSFLSWLFTFTLMFFTIIFLFLTTIFQPLFSLFLIHLHFSNSVFWSKCDKFHTVFTNTSGLNVNFRMSTIIKGPSVLCVTELEVLLRFCLLNSLRCLIPKLSFMWIKFVSISLSTFYCFICRSPNFVLNHTCGVPI